MDDPALLLVALSLVLVNGFFVAAEFAIVKLRRTQAEELARAHGVFGRALRHVRHHLDAYLSACQLGITLASLGLGWIGEPAVARLLARPLAALGVASPDVVHGVSLAVAFTLISFLHIVLGELAPKSLALRKTTAISLATAAPLLAFYWLMYPFIWVLNGSAMWLLKRCGLDAAQVADEAHSAEEIRTVLAASHRHGELGTYEADILSRALEFTHIRAGDLMRPAARMVVIDLCAPLAQTRALIRKHRYSRYPVCERDRDTLLGLVHVKDLLPMLDQQEPFDLRGVLRELPFAQRDTRALKLLRRFRRGYAHLAVITDDGGAIVGFLTLDDILAPLVGRIQDEFRRPAAAWRRAEDGSYEGRGWYSVYSLERLLGRELPAADVASIGGLLMQRLDRVPAAGDRVELDGCCVEVLEMRGPRVQRVRVRPRAELPALA